MDRFIGTKIIEATPAVRVDGKVYELNESIPKSINREDGYKIRYKDGYESWSPKSVFEEAYRPIDGMTFGIAIEAAKQGKKIKRRGWNGKNQYIELATDIIYKNSEGKLKINEHDAIGNKAFAFVGTSGIQMGWLASQADMLAEDWEIVEDNKVQSL